MNKALTISYLLVLLKCIHARPDLSLDYLYNQGHSSGGGLLLQAPKSVATSYNPTAFTSSYFAPGFFPSAMPNKEINVGDLKQKNTNFGSEFGGGVDSIGVPSLNAGFAGNSLNSGSGSGSFLQNQENPQQSIIAPIVSKHFYIHTVPSEDGEDEIVRHIQVGQPQKNYHVVFINTASAHTTKAKIIADIAPTEENTAIYVLAKKNNALDISAEVNTPAPINNKPEVFFVKYKTPEEAVRAQHSIQTQYDALDGTSDLTTDYQMPVSSAVGTLKTASNTQESYLPANSLLK